MGAQGLKGAVKIKLFTETPEAIDAHGPLHDARGRQYKITALRPGKPGEAVISFSGIDDRSAAEALKGTELFVTRDALPETSEEEAVPGASAAMNRGALVPSLVRALMETTTAVTAAATPTTTYARRRRELRVVPTPG